MKHNTAGAVIVEGHVQGLSNTRALGEAGIPVIVVDKRNAVARYSKYCQGFFLCPDFITDEFAHFLISLAKEEKLSGWILIPSNDHAVYTISKFKKELEAYFRILTPKIDTIKKIYDKDHLLRIADRLGVAVPQTRIADEKRVAKHSFPVLIKGRNGLSFYRSNNKKAFVAENPEQINNILSFIEKNSPLNEVLIQELIPFENSHHTVSFTAFAVEGVIHTFWMGEKIREHPLKFGTATFCKSVHYPELISPSERLLKEINYSGVCEIEYLKDPRDGQYKLIEINPRTWLWVGLAKACGIDYAKMIYHHFYGENDKAKPVDYPVGIGWSNYLTDGFFSLKAVLKRHLSLKELFASYKGKVIHAVHDKSDINPGIMYLLFIAKFLRDR